MISISHWGMFEMQAAGTAKFRVQISPDKVNVTANLLPTSFFVSRQDKPEDPKLHKFY